MQVDEGDATDRLVNGCLITIGLGHGIDGQVSVISDDSGVPNGVVSGDRGRDTEFFDVGADQFFFVDTVNGVLAQAEQERRHDGAEVEGGVAREDVVNGAQVVFTGAAVARD